MRRRTLLRALGLGTVATGAFAWWRFEQLMAPSALRALGPRGPRSAAAEALVQEFIAGLDGHPAIDVHAHAAGRGEGSPSWTNPRLDDPWSPVDRVRARAFRAAGLPDPDAPDAAWIAHLAALADRLPFDSRHLLLPFDLRISPGGEEDRERSEFHVPDRWVREEVRAHGRLRAGASIHPDREDALDRLGDAAAAGVRVVKWLPSAMGIDPASERYVPFYERCATLGLWLLVHSGEERAVGDASEAAWNSPLRLRTPLEAGARVIVGHCGAGGHFADLDAQGRPEVPAVELFLRLAREWGPEGRLLGDLSTVANVNHYALALPALLGAPDVHPWLVNGSDWPLPAVGPLVWLDPLVRAGHLAEADLPALRELFEESPLLFDFLLKARVRHPDSQQRFPGGCFQAREWLG